VSDLLVWDSQADFGDLYTPSLRGPKFSSQFRGSKVIHKGPVRAAIETRWSFGSGRERMDARVTLIVDANAPFVRVHVAGTNAASDHRLRLGFATDLRDARVWADAMFGAVERKPIVVTPAEATMETPPATDPLHRYVSLFNANRGVTVFSDGLGEYEAASDGNVYVTLVRSVSELSRNDLPERSGHAGWPTHTPEAQCHGQLAAELAFMMHGARTNAVIDEIERVADDVLLPLTGASLRSALMVPSPFHGVALSGEGLACSAVTTSQNGAWLVLRCVNLTDTAQRGAWTVGFEIAEAQIARLDETPLGSVAGHGNRVEFAAPARAVITILVH
jgi:alpha-mannosidase